MLAGVTRWLQNVVSAMSRHLGAHSACKCQMHIVSGQQLHLASLYCKSSYASAMLPSQVFLASWWPCSCQESWLRRKPSACWAKALLYSQAAPLLHLSCPTARLCMGFHHACLSPVPDFFFLPSLASVKTKSLGNVRLEIWDQFF